MKKKIKAETNAKPRLDRYLALKLKISRSQIKKLIDKGRVKVSGKPVNAHYGVLEGDIIECSIPTQKKLIEPGRVNYFTLYRDREIAIINKGPGVIVHPAPTVDEATLLNALSTEYESPHLVHRLDKDTSGVMIIALNRESALNIRKQFAARKVKKIYKALVEGRVEKKSGEIGAPIKRSRRDPTKMTVGWVGARKSLTRFNVVELYEKASQLELYPITGRTHQIRVHLSYYGNPVIGDKKYSQKPIEGLRHLLHAEQISFRHPGSGKRQSFSAPLPDDFISAVEKLRKKVELKL